jgi:transketolase
MGTESTPKVEKIATRDAYGQALAELGDTHPEIVVLDADLSKSTKTETFAKKFPDRFFQMGIAEANMMGVAAGLARCGKVPFASTFSIFASGRAWEQVRNTIAYSALNVKIVATHGGVSVGADGSSHQCIEDFATMGAIPTMRVVCPCDGPETKRVIKAVAETPGPFYVRLGRAKVPTITDRDAPFELGKGIVMRKGNDVTIFACGALVANALQAAEKLAAENVQAAVINLHTVKPLDESLIGTWAARTGAVVTAEEHVLRGGLGSAVALVLGRICPVPLECIGINDQFGQSGDPEELFEHYGLTAAHIAEAARKAISRRG